MFAITHITASGRRVLTFSNDPRNHSPRKIDLETRLKKVRPRLTKILGRTKAATLEVQWIEPASNGNRIKNT